MIQGCEVARLKPWEVDDALWPVVDGRQVALPIWSVKDRDQEHEPVVHRIAVPERLHRRHTAREGRGAGCERGEVQRIRRRALHAVAQSLALATQD